MIKMSDIIDVGITWANILDYVENGLLIFRGDLQWDLTSQYNFTELNRKMCINGVNSDRVCVTDDCYTKLCHKYATGLSSFKELKNNIILDDFVFSIKGRKSFLYKNRGQSTSDAIENIWYMKPSVREYSIRILDGTIYKVTPIKDVIVDETIFTFGVMTCESDITCDFLFATVPLEKDNGVWDEKYGLFYDNDKYAEMTMQYLDWIWDYINLYLIFTNKPELMTLRTRSVAVVPVDGEKIQHNKKNKRNKVKIVKYIDINTDDIRSSGGKHNITCPSWGVVGHWRTYKKTGKKIWIAPYKKGKQRDNMDMYKPKDYSS